MCTHSEGSISKAMLMLSPAGAAPEWLCGGSGRCSRATWKPSARDHPLHVLLLFIVFHEVGNSLKPCDSRCHTKSWRPTSFLTHEGTFCAAVLGDAAAVVRSISTAGGQPLCHRACSPLGDKTLSSKREKHLYTASQCTDTKMNVSLYHPSQSWGAITLLRMTLRML